MKRFGIEVAECNGKNVTLIVHYNPEGRLVGGGRHSWLIALQGYALKHNSTIDDIQRQPVEELEAIKQALEMAFDYLNCPPAYKFVKVQVAMVMKSRQGWLKKKIKKGELQPRNCNEAHWEQLKKVLMQDENVHRVIQMTKVQATQNTTF
jgi:hypothetical protein